MSTSFLTRIPLFAVFSVLPVLGGADGCLEENPITPFQCESTHRLVLERGETRPIPNLCAGGQAVTTWDTTRFELALDATPPGIEADIAAMGDAIELRLRADEAAPLGLASGTLSVRLRGSQCSGGNDCLREIALSVEVVEPGTRPAFTLDLRVKDAAGQPLGDTVTFGETATLVAQVTGAAGPVELEWRALALVGGAADTAVDGIHTAQVTTSRFEDLDRVYRVTAIDRGATPPTVVTADRVLRAEAPWPMGPVSGSIPSYPGADFEVSIPRPAQSSGCAVVLEEATGVDLAHADDVLSSAFVQASTPWREVSRSDACRFAWGADLSGREGIFRLVFTAENDATAQRAHYVLTFKRAY